MKTLSKITQDLKLNIWNGIKIDSNSKIGDGINCEGISDAIEWEFIPDALDEAYMSGFADGKLEGSTEGYSEGHADAENEFENNKTETKQ